MKRTYSLAVLVLVSAIILTGCLTPTEGRQSLITVNGSAVIEAVPDTAAFTVSVSELADTTREAQNEVNSKVAALLEIAEKNGIPEDRIKTVSLSINPEYEWRDSTRHLIGQRVRQTMSITVTGIDEQKEQLARLLDGLGQISGMEISSFDFFVESTESLYEEARELAFSKALEKARQYADLGQVTLGEPVRITEQSQDQVYRNSSSKGMLMAEAAVYAPTQLPSGSFSVQLSVSVDFEIL